MELKTLSNISSEIICVNSVRSLISTHLLLASLWDKSYVLTFPYNKIQYVNSGLPIFKQRLIAHLSGLNTPNNLVQKISLLLFSDLVLLSQSPLLRGWTKGGVNFFNIRWSLDVWILVLLAACRTDHFLENGGDFSAAFLQGLVEGCSFSKSSSFPP